MAKVANYRMANATREMRILLGVAAGLVFVAGVQLFILTDHTDQYFAWTVRPPITGAFLGAAYWSSFVLEAIAASRKGWARVRIAVPTAFTFTTLTLFMTLLHLDKFHFTSNDPGAQVAAWAWLLVYLGVPPTFLLLIVRQIRVPGGDPPRRMRIPNFIRGTLWVQGAILALAGLLMFVIPEVVEPFWPWTLTPLTARAIGSWLLALSVAAFHALWEDDLDRILPGMVSYMLFGMLQIVALTRYSIWVRWSETTEIFYVLLCLSMAVVGFAGIFCLRIRAARLLQGTRRVVL